MNRQAMLWPAGALVTTLLAVCACAPATSQPTAPAAVHWTYEGEEGPAHWGDLSPDYATCSSGQAQSPIDLATWQSSAS